MFKYSLLISFAWFNLYLIAQEQNQLRTVLQKGHSNLITSYDFSPDGKFVATGSKDNSIIIWNIITGKMLRVINAHSDEILSVSFSSDGNKILSASKDNYVKEFDVLTGEQINAIKGDRNEIDIAFYNANYVVYYDRREGVNVYNSQGKNVGKFERSYGVSNNDLIIHPDGKRILCAEDYQSFLVIDIHNHDTLKRIAFDKTYMFSFSPNGKYIAVSSAKLFTQIFDATTYQLLYTFENQEKQCDGCNTKHVFANSGNYLISMSNYTSAAVYDLSNGKMIKDFKTVDERPTGIKFSKLDEFVAITVDNTLYIYDTKSGKEIAQVENEYLDYYDIKIDPISNLILLPGSINEGILYDLKNGKKRQILAGFNNKKKDDGMRFKNTNWTDQGILKYIRMKRQVELSPDGTQFVIGNIDSSALIINVANGKIEHTLKAHRQVVYAFDYSPDGKWLATAGGDRKICIWDSKSGILMHELKGHQELIFDINFDADGTKLISGSWDGTMRVWDMQNIGEFHWFDLGNVSPYTVNFTNNGLYAVTGDLDRNVDFWEIDAGESFRTLVGHTAPISDLSFNTDGKKLATASWDGKIKVWDILTGMLTAKHELHSGAVYAVAYHPTQNILFSGGADNKIVVWNFEENKHHFLSGHTSPVTSLQINKQGDKLFSCDVDGTVKCWDLNSNQELFSRIQLNRIDWLATTPDGSFEGSTKSMDLINYVFGMEVIPVSSLFDKYYTPDLIQKVNSGQKQTTTGENIHQLIKETPVISFDIAGINVRSTMEVDSILDWEKSILPIGIIINSQGNALDEIRIYNNGKLIVQETIGGEMIFRGEASDVRKFEIELNAGVNEISAIVVNNERTESAPIQLNVNYNGVQAATDLFVLSIGINNYKNPQYNLAYAVNDAQSFVSTLKLHGDSLFETVNLIEIYNDQATRENILNGFNSIIEKVGPEDVFVFYYAGHGIMSYDKDPAKSDFYIVTHDITNLYSETIVLQEKAVSATDLMNYSMKISAAKQLFILDACHSGGALEAFATRGEGREKALAQLARSTGTFFITAAQDAQYANEVGDLKHGLFTYALLEILNGQQGNNGDNKITISELKVYVEERVPQLSEQYRGSAQYPTSYGYGQDFPIVILH